MASETLQNDSSFILSDWKSPLRDELLRTTLRDQWPYALRLIAWSHLTIFATCQCLFTAGDKRPPIYVGLWFAEFFTNLMILRSVAGRAWSKSTPLIGMIARIWATYLILALNVATLNSLTGLENDWFKPVWATLSTFGFAATAYLASPWFFVPAAQMYFTGLGMALNPDWSYLIFGCSWWLILHLVAWRIKRVGARAGLLV